MISEDYREQNRALHAWREDYGTSGYKWADFVKDIAKQASAQSILDYGCGKQTLSKALPDLPVKNYDPCIPGLDTPPEPADIVVCGDVLEHIEPDCLDDVLGDLQRLTRKAIFLVVATRPAVKTLTDGRNAHLIQEGAGWWLPRIMERFDLRMFQALNGEFICVGAKC